MIKYFQDSHVNSLAARGLMAVYGNDILALFYRNKIIIKGNQMNTRQSYHTNIKILTQFNLLFTNGFV